MFPERLKDGFLDSPLGHAASPNARHNLRQLHWVRFVLGDDDAGGVSSFHEFRALGGIEAEEFVDDSKLRREVFTLLGKRRVLLVQLGNPPLNEVI